MMMKKVAARARTIRYSVGRTLDSEGQIGDIWQYRRFAFPELVFLRSEISVRVGILSRNRRFSPFCFFNIDRNGILCIPVHPDSLEDAIDLFWFTEFDDSYSSHFPLNEKIGAISFSEWEKRTTEDPGFMEREFDPSWYAKTVGSFAISSQEL